MRQKKVAFQQWLFSTTARSILLALIAVFGVLYVIQMSSISTKGYEISDLEQSITLLQRDTDRLEYKISNYRSMKSIQERLGSMDMVVADNISYATTLGTAVARR